VAAGEQPFSPVRGELRTAPPSEGDPAGWLLAGGRTEGPSDAAGAEISGHAGPDAKGPVGSGRESWGTGGSGRGSEPTWLLEETSRIMNKLDDWQRKCEDHEKRYRAVREEMATLDDDLACAEERLAPKRAAELEEQAKVVEQQLPVIAARLSMLWNEVTGSGRPVPSEIQLTSTGTKMTTEEHVVTAETHLRYVEGHLQPSEEHLADAEVHLKLVKAHLAALDVAESAKAGPLETATPLSPEPSGGEAEAGQAKAAPVERGRSPAVRPRAGPAQRGGSLQEKLRERPPPGAGEEWACPVNECQDSVAHPLDECEEFKGLLVIQRRKALNEWDRCECCLTDRPRNEQNDTRILQPDVIIGWADWNKVQSFAMSS
jgi:hypothetical protein